MGDQESPSRQRKATQLRLWHHAHRLSSFVPPLPLTFSVPLFLTSTSSRLMSFQHRLIINTHHADILSCPMSYIHEVRESFLVRREVEGSRSFMTSIYYLPLQVTCNIQHSFWDPFWAFYFRVWNGGFSVKSTSRLIFKYRTFTIGNRCFLILW